MRIGIGLYLSFCLNWVLGSFVHGRLQNLQTSEVISAHVITPSSKILELPEFYCNYDFYFIDNFLVIQSVRELATLYHGCM